MTQALFRGGPLDGQQFEIPFKEPLLEIDVSDAHVAGKRVRIFPLGEGNVIAHIRDGRLVSFVIGPADEVPRTRYSLHFIDPKGIAHYYIPTSSRPTRPLQP